MYSLEKCPGCKKNITWKMDVDYYCIDGTPDNVKTINSDHGRINLHYCPCGRLLGIDMETDEGGEVFINAENITTVENFIDDLCERDEVLLKHGLKEFDSQFVHWDEVIKAVCEGWDNVNPGYDSHPQELINKLIDEKNELMEALELINKLTDPLALNNAIAGSKELLGRLKWYDSEFQKRWKTTA